MKKYISILSLAAAFVMQSCDRSDLVSKSDEQILEKLYKPLERTAVNSQHTDEETHINLSKPDTGDDDEPRKDKSHWRLPVDTVKQ